jgi:succinoglycan biosynthesis protein ExoO
VPQDPADTGNVARCGLRAGDATFSVVIPLYNKAPHVAAAVESALGQSWSPLEVIVVDDGSTDGGADLLRSITDPRLRLLNRAPPGPGGYAARNLGIEHARGEWVAFLDADDLWLPDHLRGLATAIEASGPCVACAFSGVELVFPDKREARPHARDLLVPNRPIDFETMLRAWVQTGECPLWTGALAIRRQLLIDVGLFPAGRARRGGDKDLWLRAIARADCVHSGLETAEFHQVAVNRVSDITPHSDAPLVTGTIADLISAVRPETAALLKKVSNLEIERYARYSAGRGAPMFRRLARRLYFPSGFAALAKVAAYYVAGMAVRRLRGRQRS